MRPQSLLLLAAALGPPLVLAAFLDETRRGEDYAVRYAWMHLVPQMLTLLAMAGLWVLTRLPKRQAQGVALTALAFTALGAHASLVLFVPLRAWESENAQVWPELDILGFSLAVALLLVVLQRPHPARRLQALSLGYVALAGVLVGRMLWQVMDAPSASRVVGFAFGLAALALGYAMLRRLSPRAIRG